MNVKGLYINSKAEMYECVLVIKHGIVHSVTLENAKPIEYFNIPPKNNTSFKYYKLPNKKSVGQANSNYKIEYENKNGTINTVYSVFANYKPIIMYFADLLIKRLNYATKS